MSPLKKIPSVAEILENPTVKSLIERMHPGAVLSTARAVLDEVAAEVHSVATERTMPSMTELAERIVRRVSSVDAPGLRPVVNASGVVFHAELGPPPLADRAIDAAAAAWRHAMAGVHGPTAHAAPAESLLVELTGGEAALVVGNAAGASVLAMAAAAEEREVVVSRGQIVRRGGTHDAAGLAAMAGVTLHEVGAVDGTGLDDYRRALGEWTGAILSVDLGPMRPTNGTSAQPTTEELVHLAREHGLPLIRDLGPASLIDLAPFDLAAFPTVARAVAGGADLVVFGHELLGGPPCGVIVGRRELVDRARRHALSGLMPAERAVTAALAATLELAKDAEQARRTIPTLQLLTTSSENLKNRAVRLAQQMAGSPAIASAEAVERVGRLADWPHLAGELPTWCIALTPAEVSADRLASLLREGGPEHRPRSPTVLTRLEEPRLLLDLRSVLPRDDLALVDAVAAC